jgi:hypothetical protein
MASSFNLIRDSRVFFTTNVNNYGVVQSSGFSSGAYGAANTWEIQVQDGFSFSQNTTTETVTLSEAGDTPNRGQRNFNTALEAVDFTFSTYIRPRDAGSVIDAEEGVLWNAMFSAAPVGFTDLSGVALAGTTGTSGINGQLTCTATTLAVGGQVTIAGTNTATSSGTAGTAGVIANGTYYIIATNGTTTLTLGATATSTSGIVSYTGPISGLTFTYVPPAASKLYAWQPKSASAVCTLENSGKHQLQQFGLIIVLGGTTFVIDNCVMDSATIDFGLDAIASIAWAGKGSTLRQLNNSPVLSTNTTSGVVTLTPSSSALSGVALAGTTGTSGINGQLTCTASTTALQIGGTVTISGTNTATSSGTAGTAGVIANGTYYIIATNGTTTLTLGATATSLVGITSYTGPIAGLTFTYAAPGSVTGTSNWKNINAPYLANKLSTVTLDTGIGPGGTVYNIAITGGSLTFANNVNYLTPANLGVVNTPIVYFTGTRAISGTMNAYLRTGALQTAGLLKSLLEGSSTTVDPQFYMKLSIGGNPTATTRVDIEMPAVMLTIPTVATEQVVSTTISFTAQGSASSAFDIEQLNEVSLTYIAPQV